MKLTDFNKEAHRLSEKALAELRKLVLDIPNNGELFSHSVHYEGVDKLVLWNSKDKKMQIRLHLYSGHPNNTNADTQINIGNAHNHRWNFSTHILSGGYLHTIYHMNQLAAEKYSLTPTMIRYENMGSYYTLHHSQYHSIIEEPNTVTLIVRGPLEKESFQVITEENGEIQIQNAPTMQPSKEKKTMTLTEYEKALNQLLFLKII